MLSVSVKRLLKGGKVYNIREVNKRPLSSTVNMSTAANYLSQRVAKNYNTGK